MATATATNLTAKDFRNQLAAIVADALATLPDDLAALQPNERINALCKLFKFIVPEYKSLEGCGVGVNALMSAWD